MQKDRKYCTEEKKFFLFEMENRMNKISRIDNERIISTGNRIGIVRILYFTKLAIDATIVAKEAKEVA